MNECPFCGTSLSQVYYSTACPSCGKSLHACRCCQFYSPQSHYGCRESVDELVQDKDRPNFCDFFRLTENKIGNEQKEKAAQAEAAFDAFFNI